MGVVAAAAPSLYLFVIAQKHIIYNNTHVLHIVAAARIYRMMVESQKYARLLAHSI